MIKRSILYVIVLSVQMAVATAACKSTAAPTPSSQSPGTSVVSNPIKFGVVLVGPRNDHGWSEAHYDAALYVTKKIPGSDFVYIDKLNPADRPNTTLAEVVADMVSKGVGLIFTTGDDFQADTLALAPKYPKIVFVNVSGDMAWRDGKNHVAPPNYGNFTGRVEFMKMIAGCAAALTTRTGKIGYIGALINDETRRLASAAYLGAKYCWTNYSRQDPANLRFEVKWIGYWFNIPGVTLDPTVVSNDFYSSGTDVLLSGLDTTEALVVAGQRQKKGEIVYAIPYDYKLACNEASAVCIGAPYFNWGPRYLKTVEAYISGTWKQTWDWDDPDWRDINNVDTSAVGFTFGDALSVNNKAVLDEFIKGLGNGSINLWKGPILLQDGTYYIKEGNTATDTEIWYLPELLQGMIGASVLK